MAWFFGATAHASVLHVDGIPDRGPWDAGRCILLDEAVVDRILVAGARVRKISTVAELAGAMRESDGSSAAIRLYVRESLNEAVRTIWQRMHSSPEDRARRIPSEEASRRAV